MRVAREGDWVTIHARGSFADGTLLEPDGAMTPLRARLGDGLLLPAVEARLAGMAPGERAELLLTPAEAYGEPDPALCFPVAREEIPPEVDCSLGAHWALPQPTGETFWVRVTGVAEGEVTVDANHPLAGRTLRYELKLVAIDDDPAP